MRVAVIGIGNTLMGDDGVGVRVAEHIRAMRLGEDVDVAVGHLAGMQLMPHVLAADAVVFVDALAAGDEPGTMYRFDPDDAGVSGLRSTTTHGMSIPYLIANSRLKGHRPRFIVYAVHVGDIMCGPDTLSPPVEASLPRVVSLVAEEVEALIAETPPMTA